MKVLLATAEALPYFATGGLAVVARSLSDALRARDLDVRLIMPAYPVVRPADGSTEREPELHVPWIDGTVTVSCAVHQPGPGRAPAVLLERPGFFGTAEPYGYLGEDEVALASRFGFFSRAVVAYAARWGADVVHLNDWPTGLVPIYAQLDGWDGATVFAIHNLPYHGSFSRGVLPRIGIPDAFYRTENGLECYGQVSFMKAGISFADRLVTVSPTYAREIQTPAFGAGLDGLLRFRRRALYGILNGITPEEWDPATDPALPAHYHAHDLAGKEEARSALLRELGLEDGGPLVVLVTRMARQKGLDLLLAALPELLQTSVRIAILGDGDSNYEAALGAWGERARGRFATRFVTDDRLARRFYAGGDFFLMPSLYEPCGLGQLTAQRYGTIPIVRRTGGLADTVTDGETGFSFDEASPAALVNAVARATAIWRDEQWTQLRQHCMQLDHSWHRSADLYEQVYRLAIGRISA